MAGISSVNQIDPILLRRFYASLSGVDPGTNPQFAAGLVEAAIAAGIVPVIPVGNRHPGFSVPLDVYPRGWWGGGTVSIGDSGSAAQIQTLKTGTTGNDNDGATIYTVTTGKTFYCTGWNLGSKAAAGVLMQMKVGGTAVVQVYVPSYGSVAVQGSFPAFSASSGQTITITGAGAAANSGGVFGWEE